MVAILDSAGNGYSSARVAQRTAWPTSPSTRSALPPRCFNEKIGAGEQRRVSRQRAADRIRPAVRRHGRHAGLHQQGQLRGHGQEDGGATPGIQALRPSGSTARTTEARRHRRIWSRSQEIVGDVPAWRPSHQVRRLLRRQPRCAGRLSSRAHCATAHTAPAAPAPAAPNRTGRQRTRDRRRAGESDRPATRTSSAVAVGPAQRSVVLIAGVVGLAASLTLTYGRSKS